MEENITSTCNFCDRVFTSMTELAKHLSEHYDSLHKKEDVEAEEIKFEDEDDPVKKEVNFNEYGDPLSSNSFATPSRNNHMLSQSKAETSTSSLEDAAREEVNYPIKVEDGVWDIDVKMEAEDGCDSEVYPKQKYNKLKSFEGTLFRRDGTKWECLGCSSIYDSNHGLYYHLKTTKCGFGQKDRGKPKAKWNQYYSKQGDAFSCIACGKIYETIRGIHYHLSKTSVSCAVPGACGEMAKREEGSGPKMSWSSFYTRREELFVCLTCDKEYESVNGMHYHLKTTPACTTNFVVVKQEEEVVPQLEEEVEGRPMPSYRRDYRHLYSKGPQGELECLACGVQYLSVHGLHCHLNTTSCGFGEKSSKGRIKTSYAGLYRKESDSCFVCLGCGSPYSSMHGLHYHLNRTRCGYGEQEKCQTKRNYKGLYVRQADSLYHCLGPGCGYAISYLTGMHRHLRECPVSGPVKGLEKAEPGLPGTQLGSSAGLGTPPMPLQMPPQPVGMPSMPLELPPGHLGMDQHNFIQQGKEGKDVHWRNAEVDDPGRGAAGLSSVNWRGNQQPFAGFGRKDSGKPRAKWNQFYLKQGDAFSCIACGKFYETIRGMHYHLSKTSVGCAVPIANVGSAAVGREEEEDEDLDDPGLGAEGLCSVTWEEGEEPFAEDETFEQTSEVSIKSEIIVEN